MNIHVTKRGREEGGGMEGGRGREGRGREGVVTMKGVVTGVGELRDG
jgi:hypothetical protein